jgi:valyl-tRNA synthetase
LRTSQTKIEKDFDNFRFSEAYDTLYHFIWDDLADWYVEASKIETNKPLLAYLLEQVLILAHPFAPFLTETIWQTLAWEGDSILAARRLEEVIKSDKKQAVNFTALQAIITEVRSILKALHASGITLYYNEAPLIAANADLIKRLSGLKAVTEVQTGNGLYLTSTQQKAWLDIPADTAKAYAKELIVKAEAQKNLIKQLEGRLNNESYVKNAPKELVAQTKDQLKEAKGLLSSLNKETQRFS